MSLSVEDVRDFVQRVKLADTVLEKLQLHPFTQSDAITAVQLYVAAHTPAPAALAHLCLELADRQVPDHGGQLHRIEMLLHVPATPAGSVPEQITSLLRLLGELDPSGTHAAKARERYYAEKNDARKP